jgi:hypothetical protein
MALMPPLKTHGCLRRMLWSLLGFKVTTAWLACVLMRSVVWQTYVASTHSLSVVGGGEELP